MSAAEPDLVEREMFERRWTYIGRRFGRAGVLFTFIDHRGEQVSYPKCASGMVVGGVYEVRATEDSASAAVRAARYVEASRHDLVETWRLADLGARNRLEQERAVKRAAKENGHIGAMTLDDVRAAMRSQPSPVRSGTLAAVIGYLNGAGL